MHEARGPCAGLDLDLRWRGAGGWYALQARCAMGLTVVAGPGAPALLRLLAGRPVPHDGRALLDGRRLRRAATAARYGPGVRPVASLLADDAPPPWRTPLGLAASAARAQGVPFRLARARAAQALGWAGMSCSSPDAARRPLALLGRVERRRAALAAALASVPGLLLLERPCAPLPAAEHGPLYATLRELAARWEMIVLVLPEVPLPGVPLLEPPSLAGTGGP